MVALSRASHASELDDADEIFDATERSLQHAAFLVREIDLDDALDAAGAEYDGHADVIAVDSALALEVRGARQDALLVLEIALGHFDRGCGRRHPGARLQQVDDFATRHLRALDD